MQAASLSCSGQTGPSLGKHARADRVSRRQGVVERPRVRVNRGKTELALPSWSAAISEDWLGKWALNLMLINVSTRRFGRAVRLPEGDVPTEAGSGVSKSAVLRYISDIGNARTAFRYRTSASGFVLRLRTFHA